MPRPVFLLAFALTAASARPVFADPPVIAAAPQKDAKPAPAAFDPTRLWDGRGMVPFRAADFPKMAPASAAGDFLNDDEYVLGVTVNGESRAYPTRFVWWHHVVNDKVEKGGRTDYFAITYCSVCNTGARYDLALGGGEARRLDFYGLYNGVVALCDRETKSVFLQVSGAFADGPLAGKALKPAPLLDTTWGRWKKLHPATLVMSPEGPFAKVYAPKGVAEARGHDRFPIPVFRPTVTRGDLRLPPSDKVLGVSVPGEAKGTTLRRAYPMKTLVAAGGVVNDTLGASTPIAVFIEPDTQTAIALSRVVDGRTLTFEARKADGETHPAFFDKETGTRWSLEGMGETGPLAGKSLSRVDNHLSQWYGWAAYYPDTSIFGRDDPPQPGDPFAEPAATRP